MSEPSPESSNSHKERSPVEAHPLRAAIGNAVGWVSRELNGIAQVWEDERRSAANYEAFQHQKALEASYRKPVSGDNLPPVTLPRFWSPRR